MTRTRRETYDPGPPCARCGNVRHNVTHHDPAFRAEQVAGVYGGFDYYADANIVYHPFEEPPRDTIPCRYCGQTLPRHRASHPWSPKWSA